MEFWAQVTWDCSFQTSGSQGQPHVNAGLWSVRQLSAIWLQTKRNCLVSRSARWSYICEVSFYCLHSFWRFKLLIFRILEMFLLWMILYNYIIPLSMYVCLELGTKNYSKILKKFKMFDIQKFQNIQYLKSSKYRPGTFASRCRSSWQASSSNGIASCTMPSETRLILVSYLYCAFLYLYLYFSARARI